MPIRLLNRVKARFSSSDMARRVASGMAWSFLATASSKLIVLASGVVCARILGKEIYGEFSMLKAMINMLLVLGAGGMGLTATKYIAEYKDSDKRAAYSIFRLTTLTALALGLVVSMTVLVFAGDIANVWLHADYLRDSVMVMAIVLFITFYTQPQNGVLLGFEDFKAVAVNTFISDLIKAVFMAAGAYYYGVFGAISGYGLGYMSLVFINKLSIKKNLKKFEIPRHRYTGDGLNYWRVLYKFSIPAIMSSIMVLPVFYIVRQLLLNADGYGAVAVYDVADQWRLIPCFIPAALAQVILPILSNVSGQKDSRAKFLKLLKYNAMVNALVAAVVALVICLFSDFLMKLYGKGFDDPAPMIVLALSTVFVVVANVYGIAISSKAQMWGNFMLNFIWAAVLICSSYFTLLKGWGVVGVTYSILVAYGLHALNSWLYFHLFVKNKLNSEDI